jgi:two-component system OmpR family response regulator
MRHRVLVVDDDNALRNLVSMVLADSGFDVDSAESGTVALKKIQESPPDIVTLDLLMPDMNGFELVDRLRTVPQPPRIVIISGSIAFSEERGPWPEFVAGVLMKPFRINDLRTMCELALTPTPAGVVEKRSVPRRVLITEVSVLDDSGRPMLSGKMTKLSPCGAELLLDVPYETGKILRFEVPVPGGEGFVVEGRVLYRKQVPEGFLYGLVLTDNDIVKQLIRGFLGPA